MPFVVSKRPYKLTWDEERMVEDKLNALAETDPGHPLIVKYWLPEKMKRGKLICPA